MRRRCPLPRLDSASLRVCAPMPGLRQQRRVLRRVYLGGALTAGEPGGRAWWAPHELLEHLQAAYCSTLAVELDHLTSL